jgi:hypothetical protein
MLLTRATFFLVLSCTGALAAGDIPPIPEGTPYATARGVLIGKSFRPVVSGDRDYSRCSAMRQGTGSAACRFIFSGPNGASVTLVAEGPNVGRLKVTAARRSAKTDIEWQRGSARP